MNNEIKAQWIAALRSGEYQQTRGFLKVVKDMPRVMGDDVPVGHCCLGVLCELAVQAGVIPPAATNAPSGWESEYAWFGMNTGELPDEVVEWAGLGENTPEVQGHDLAEWNDELEADFNKIADLIEANL